MKKKLKSLKSLKKLAWKWFSIHVRKSAADWRGIVKCVTCGAEHEWNSGEIHAGHWIHDKLDYDEKNVHPQCAKCNYKYNKNTNVRYAVFMANTYGPKVMQELINLANQKGNDYSREELLEVIERYRN